MPFSLSDDELDQILGLATAIPHAHRRAFLREVANALAAYPEGCRGVGLVHRVTMGIQRQYATNRVAQALDGTPGAGECG
jgi:hypothetical protein